MMRGERGQSAVEFAIAMPLVMLFLVVAIEVSMLCVTGELLGLAAFRGSRAAKVFVPAGVEAWRMLPRTFVDEEGGSSESISFIHELGSATGFGPFGSEGGLSMEVPRVAALPPGLGDELLTRGDNPSPYCRHGDEYKGLWSCETDGEM